MNERSLTKMISTLGTGKRDKKGLLQCRVALFRVVYCVLMCFAIQSGAVLREFCNPGWHSCTVALVCVFLVSLCFAIQGHALRCNVF